MTRIRRHVWIGLIPILVSCAYFEPAAAHQLDLTGTSWKAVSIDGEPLDPEVLVAFPDLSSVIVGEGCLQYRADLALDTDGSAIGFGEFEPVAPNPCPSSPAITAAGDLIGALAGAEEWRVDGDRVDITGAHDVVLARRRT
ncbi:MAG TPA: META domain-containing protein [Candidatus Limnocylindria bacterium]|nr:META domain-containing protein [Candidatus Limnocylindria bacterium]